MENQNSVTYAEAGVDIVEGARAVDAIKDTVHSTYRPEVVGDIAASAAYSPSRPPRTWPIPCWFPAPTAWARS